MIVIMKSFLDKQIPLDACEIAGSYDAADPRYSTWLTKQQAAQALQVSTKTVEKLADAKQIQQARWKRPTGGPALAVFHPGDVERLRQERNPEAPPFVLPALGEDSAELENVGLVPFKRGDAELSIQSLFAELMRSVTSAPKTSASVGIERKVYLNLQEAIAYSGLGKTCLLGKVRAGKLAAAKAGGWRIRRTDLDNLILA
jgi:hypothetical protein